MAHLCCSQAQQGRPWAFSPVALGGFMPLLLITLALPLALQGALAAAPQWTLNVVSVHGSRYLEAYYYATGQPNAGPDGNRCPPSMGDHHKYWPAPKYAANWRAGANASTGHMGQVYIHNGLYASILAWADAWLPGKVYVGHITDDNGGPIFSCRHMPFTWASCGGYRIEQQFVCTHETNCMGQCQDGEYCDKDNNVCTRWDEHYVRTQGEWPAGLTSHVVAPCNTNPCTETKVYKKNTFTVQAKAALYALPRLKRAIPAINGGNGGFHRHGDWCLASPLRVRDPFSCSDAMLGSTSIITVSAS